MESCEMDWFYLFLLHPQPVTLSLLLSYLNETASPPASPGEAPPGSRQRAEDGGEGQSREERVEGEVEQSFHPVVAQALQRVNVVLQKQKTTRGGGTRHEARGDPAWAVVA